MNAKKLLASIFALAAVGCMTIGVNSITNYQASAEVGTFTEVDVTSNVKIHYWSNTESKATENPSYTFLINLGADVNAKSYGNSGAYFYLNDNAMKNECDVMSYIQINGVTARSIVGENGQDGGSNGWSACTDAGEFALSTFAPIQLQSWWWNSGGVNINGFELKITGEYITNACNGLDNLEITLMDGIVWKNTENQVLTINKTLTYAMPDNAMPSTNTANSLARKLDKLDITNKVGGLTDVGEIGDFYSINGMSLNGSTWTPLNGSETMYLNDNAMTNGCDLASYILINGVSARSIINDNADYTQDTSISSWAGAAFRPVLVTVDGRTQRLSIEITKEYLERTNNGTLDGLELTLKSGFEWNNVSEKTLYTTQDITWVYINNAFVLKMTEKVDITDKVGDLSDVGEIGDFYSINGMALTTESWAPFTGNSTMYVNDNATTNGCDLASYILINGVSARSIMNNNADYTQDTSISSWAGAAFRPVLVTVDGRIGRISVEITKEYLEQNNNGSLEGLEITLKAGFEWVNVDLKMLYTTEDITWKYINNEFSIKSNYFVAFEGGQVIEVGSGDMIPLDKLPANPTKESTAEKEYTFKGWYYEDSTGKECLFNPEECPITSDMYIYAKFDESGKKYTVTFLSENGETLVTKDVEYGAQITMETIPAKEYYTGAWVYQGDKEPLVMPASNISFKLAYTATEYTVTFYKNASGTEVLSVETYTIEDTEITEPTVATKEGYTGAWASYELKGGNVEVRPVYTLASNNDSSSNASSNEDPNESSNAPSSEVTSGDSVDTSSAAEGGCGSTVSGVSVVALAALATVLVKKKKEN